MPDPSMGETQHSSSDIAKSIVSQLADTKPVEAAPEPEPQDQDYTPEPVEQVVEQQVAEPRPQPAVEPPMMTAEEADDAYDRLREVGVDLGMRRSDVPEHLHGAYDRMVQTVVIEQTRAMQERSKAAEAVERVSDFARKLQENPEQVLLTMAIQNPDAWNKTVEQANRMADDPEYANLVRRELAAEAMLTAAKRAEAMRARQALQMRAHQVKQNTMRAAQQYGVNPEIAERVIAAQVVETSGQLTDQQIIETISQLSPTGRPLTRPPEVQRTVQQSPRPVEGKGQPSIETQDAPAKDMTQTHLRSPIRGLIKDAARRVSRGLTES